MNPKLYISLIRQIIAILSLCAFYYPIHAQQTLPVAGGHISSTGGSVSYTVGQIFYTSHSTVEGSVSQGVQQAYEIFVATAIEEAPDISLHFSAYPNPAGDFLILEIKGKWESPCIINLYDINGRLLQNQRLINPQTRLDMSRYNPAVYFLKVVEGQKELKVFRIVKH